MKSLCILFQLNATCTNIQLELGYCVNFEGLVENVGDKILTKTHSLNEQVRAW